MRLTLIIDGADYSKLMNQHSYSVAYEQRSGSNSGMLLDGSIVEDVLAHKAVLTIGLNYFRAGEISQLLHSVQSGPVQVTYFDVRDNQDRTAWFLASVGSMDYAFMSGGVKLFKDGTTLNLREV